MSMAGIGKLLNNINELPAGQQRTVQAIRQASDKTGVDFAYLVQKASIESSFNPSAKAKTSSASGLYQFVENTWLDIVDRHGADYGLQGAADAIKRDANNKPVVADKATRQQILGLRNNPQVAAVMAAELAAENTEALEARVGRKVGATEMYMAHFLGANGAGEFLTAMNKNPNTAAAKLLPDAAAANHNVFYTEGGRARTVGEVYANFAKKFDTSEIAAVKDSKPAVTADVVAKAKPMKVASAAPATKLQVLATITNDSYVASADPLAMQAAKPSMQVASADNLNWPSMDSFMTESAQFNAMMVAQQLLDSASMRVGSRDYRKNNA